MSKKHDEFQLEYRQASDYLKEHRAHFRCEIGVEGCIPSWILPAHHIKRRSDGGTNDPSNLLIPCVSCGSHANFHTGIKGKDGKAMSIEDQLALAENLNRRHGIEQ